MKMATVTLKVMRWLGAVALAMASASGSAAEYVTYLHADVQGSPLLATDEQGQVVWQEEYDPWGARQVKDAASATPGRGSKVWYTGKEEESSLGIYYFGARWYLPSIGEFSSVDPIGVTVGNTRSFSRYAYANNNPIKYVDPDGRWASKPGFEVHQGVIKEVLQDIASPLAVKTIVAAQVEADSKKYQSGAYAYRHAMRDVDHNETAEVARERANKFIRDEFQAAWNADNDKDAYRHFGLALHTLQDSTSPSHSGFQPWSDDESIRSELSHVAKELKDPGASSNLHRATIDAWRWFQDRKLPDGDLFKYAADKD